MRVLHGFVGLGLVAAVGGVILAQDDDYSLEVVMPAATNLVPGSPVQIDGEQVGTIDELAARDGKAIVTINVDEEHAPLPDGTRAHIAWKATLGERILELHPGAEGNAPLPDGGLVEGTGDRVELDQVLAALDAPTRAHVQSLVKRLTGTLEGRTEQVRATLDATGPALQALGEILRGIGADGPAIRALVTRLSEVSQVVAQRHSAVSSTVSDLSRATDVIAGNREALSRVLHELPSTLDVARSTLDGVPETVDETIPLLHDVQPATAQLPGVARQLAPTLRDLRPTVAELRPALGQLQQLLGRTPALLAATESVAPQIGQAGKALAPVLAHLRPYAPELAGWLANWGSAAAGYDSNGHYLRAFVQEGSTSVTHMPGVLPPGIKKPNYRPPGQAERQPWTDAHGSGMR